MVADFNGVKVRIPNGYHYDEETGLYMNGHGVQYQIVKYGWKDDVSYYLETVYSKHVRTIPLETAD